jgi:tetratricopeptide (TPR) repeat protein
MINVRCLLIIFIILGVSLELSHADEITTQTLPKNIPSKQETNTSSQTTSVEFEEAAKRNLTKTHPDWEDVVTSNEFKDWMNRLPNAEKERLNNSWDPYFIADKITAFKVERADYHSNNVIAGDGKSVGTIHKGKLISHYNSGGYTYLEMKDEAGIKWVAVPEIEINDNQTIEFDAVPMKNFVSKATGKVFEEIYFAPGVYIVNEKTKTAAVDYNMAIAAIDKIQTTNKTDKSIILNKINLYKNRPLSQNNGEYDVDEDIRITDKIADEYNKIFISEPKNASYYYELGQKYYQIAFLGNGMIMLNNNNEDTQPSAKLNTIAKKAVNYLTKAIKYKSSDSGYFNTRGDAYSFLKQQDNALKDYNKAITLNPENASYYGSRASIYADRKMYQRAITDMSSAIKYSDTDTNSTFNIDLVKKAKLQAKLLNYSLRGYYYENANDLEKALADFKIACELSNDTGIYCEKKEKIAKNIARGKKWVKCAGSDEMQVFYDKSSLAKIDKSKYKLWVRMEQSPDSQKEQMLSRGFDRNTVARYDDYSHTAVYYKLDCKNRELGLISSNDYDAKNNVIDTFRIDELKMLSIVPDSMGEEIYKAICK